MKFIDENGVETEDMLSSFHLIENFNNIVNRNNYKVIGLTGSWGSGKTTFIKLWENNLKEKNYIHIDAFENDYQGNAFLTIYKYLYNYFDGKKCKELPEFKESAKKFLTTSLYTAGKIGANIIIDKTIGSENYSIIKESFKKEYIDQIFEECEKEEIYLKSLKNILENITNETGQIYVVIDELDRCRPTFALEILEKIKHVFSIKNVTYIIVFNNNVIKKVVEKEYGIDAGIGEDYIQKFIEYEYRFTQESELYNWFRIEIESSEQYKNINMYYSLQNHTSNIVKLIANSNISLRNVIRLINILKEYKRTDIDREFIISFEIVRIININELEDMYNFIKEEIRNGPNIIFENGPKINTIRKVYSTIEYGIGAIPEEIDKNIYRHFRNMYFENLFIINISGRKKE